MATRAVLNPGSGRLPVEQYVGKDGQVYPTMEAAEAADAAYDTALGGGGGGLSISGKRTIGARVPVGNAPASSSGGVYGDATAEFLKKWGEINDKSLSMLQDIVTGLDTGDSGLQDTIKMLQKQAEQYQQRYGGLEEESVEATRESIRNKMQLQKQLMEGTKADIAGVEGRAATDIKGGAERARESMAREAMSYGVDPTSGKFGALTKKSMMDQVRDQAIAMDLARRGEKERALSATERASALISPEEYSNIAQGISGTMMDYGGMIGGLQTADINRMLTEGKTKADIINAMTNIGKDYGSAGLSMYGMNLGYSGESPEQYGYPTTSATGSTAMPGSISVGRDETGKTTVSSRGLSLNSSPSLGIVKPISSTGTKTTGTKDTGGVTANKKALSLPGGQYKLY